MSDDYDTSPHVKVTVNGVDVPLTCDHCGSERGGAIPSDATCTECDRPFFDGPTAWEGLESLGSEENDDQ